MTPAEVVPAPTAADKKAARRRNARAVRRTLGLAWGSSRRRYVVLLAMTAIAGIVPPVVVALGKRLVDLIAAQPVTVAQLMPVAVALGALSVGQRVLAVLQSTRQTIFSHDVTRRAEELFLAKTSMSELSRFDDPTWHDRVQRVSDELGSRPYNVVYTSIQLLSSAIVTAGMMGVLISMHPLLLVMALVSVLLPMPFQRRANQAIHAWYWAWTPQERERHYYRSLLSETSAAKDLRAFVLEGPLLQRHGAMAREAHRDLARLYTRADRMYVLGGLLGGAALVVAYVFVAARGAAGTLTPGDVTALIGAIASVTVQVSAISSALIQIDQHAPFMHDYFEFLDVRPEVVVPERPIPLPVPLRGGVEFDGVSFRYPGQGEPALHGVSLRIEPGEMMALVGDNGAGKTSLVKLLLRFYDPQDGAVRIDGVDLREVDPAALRRRIGVLFQDYTNFTVSARDAVRFGRVDHPGNDDEIWAALEGAHAADIVRKLPAQLDSPVGRMFEGGKDLSGGEWQRLALARLIYRQADIWVLDEPTSALDPEAEAAIFAELKQQLRGRIGVVISHRFSTVRMADRIAVVQDGRIAELGSHEELLALGGRYAQLFELQAAGYR